MKGLTEITLLDSTHNLGLRCKLERDLFRVVERLSADTGEATRKETVNAIGLTRRHFFSMRRFKSLFMRRSSEFWMQKPGLAVSADFQGLDGFGTFS